MQPSINSPLPHRLLSEHIDYSADAHMIPAGRETVKDRYLVQNEKSPQDAYMRCATAFASNEAHALRLYGYDYVLSIEHEDPLMSVDEGLTRAVTNLKSIMIKDQPTDMWWA